MRSSLILLIILVSGCVAKKKYQQVQRNLNNENTSSWYKEQISSLQKGRANELKKNTVHLPKYDSISDLRVILDYSVVRINREYDSALMAVEALRTSRLDSLEQELVKKKTKFFGLIKLK